MAKVKSRYINMNMKTDIAKNIKEAVTKKMDKSIPGKELASFKKKVITGLRKGILKKCSKEEEDILIKHCVIERQRNIYLTIYDVQLKTTWSRQGNSTLVLDFDPIIVTPRISNTRDYMLDIITADKKLDAYCKDAIKIQEHISCEIQETVKAYMKRIDNYRTVSSLLKAHPELEKYIPKEVKVIEPKEDNKTIKLIEAFETI